MNVEGLNSRIAVVNAESKRLNNERQVNIGKRETLTKQLNDALESYKQKYGVELTPETLEAELQRVYAEKEAKVVRLETVLNFIKNADYAGAEAFLASESQDTQEQQSQPQSESKSESVHEVPQAEEREQQVASGEHIVQPTPTIQPTPVVQSTPVAPKVPVVPKVPVAPKVPTAPQIPNVGGTGQASSAMSGLDVGDVDKTAPQVGGVFIPNTEVVGKPPVIATKQQVAPPVLNKDDEDTGSDTAPASPPPAKPMSFNAILGGTAFRPQD